MKITKNLKEQSDRMNIYKCAEQLLEKNPGDLSDLYKEAISPEALGGIGAIGLPALGMIAGLVRAGQHSSRLNVLGEELQKRMVDEGVPMTRERLEGALTEELRDKVEFVQSVEDYKNYMQKYKDQMHPVNRFVGEHYILPEILSWDIQEKDDPDYFVNPFAWPVQEGLPSMVAVPEEIPYPVLQHELGHTMLFEGLDDPASSWYDHFLAPFNIERHPVLREEIAAWDRFDIPEEDPLRETALETYRSGLKGSRAAMWGGLSGMLVPFGGLLAGELWS